MDNLFTNFVEKRVSVLKTYMGGFEMIVGLYWVDETLNVVGILALLVSLVTESDWWVCEDGKLLLWEVLFSGYQVFLHFLLRVRVCCWYIVYYQKKLELWKLFHILLVSRKILIDIDCFSIFWDLDKLQKVLKCRPEPYHLRA